VTSTDGGTYRAFCAYDARGRAPGCGWERYVDDEEDAQRLAEKHSKDHYADYEFYGDEYGHKDHQGGDAQ
jgi:hypothetical protein